MGVIYVSEECDDYHELPEEIHEAVENTMEALGAPRFGNPVLVGMGESGATVRVKVQMGTGQSLDLSDPVIRDFDSHNVMWHYSGMLGSGRVEGVHENGYITLAVRGKY